MRLVPDAKKAWKWFSVQAGMIVVALPVAWSVMPEDIKAFIPESWLPFIVGAVGLAVIFGRIVDQSK